MLDTILRRRAQALVLVLSLVLSVTAVFAATELIEAKKGGTINIAPGVRLVIRPGALEEDTAISADMIQKRDRILFRFKPSRTEFLKPAELRIHWQAIEDVEDLILYGEDGEEIEPEIRGWGTKYYIEHFSLYYFRRR